MRARVIYNPTSGKELIKKNLVEILAIIEKAGYEASAFATTPEEDSAKNEAIRAAKAGFDLIVAAGGDGTINEVVNGIAPLEKRPKLAIIPAGTTNDYARALKIPHNNIIKAAEVILKKQTMAVDVGLANDRYFINIAAGGFLTELTYEVPSKLKSIFGYLAYLVKGAEKLPQLKPINMKLVYDEDEFVGKASMFFLGLTNSVGGFEQIAPDAELDDGKFSLIIVKTANLLELLHLAALALNGKHINDPRIIYTKTSKLYAEPLDEDTRMMINLDGEYGGDAPMTFTNLYRHLEIFTGIEEIEQKEEQVESSKKAFVNEMEVLTNKDIDGDGKINHVDPKE